MSKTDAYKNFKVLIQVTRDSIAEMQEQAQNVKAIELQKQIDKTYEEFCKVNHAFAEFFIDELRAENEYLRKIK